MTIYKLQSSSISQIEFDNNEKILIVKFTNGSNYEYTGINEELVNELTKAESAGKYLHEHIKGKFSYKKLTDLDILNRLK